MLAGYTTEVDTQTCSASKALLGIVASSSLPKERPLTQLTCRIHAFIKEENSLKIVG